MLPSGGYAPIDFPSLAAALLQRSETLVSGWLPGGHHRGREYVCADLSGGEGGSFSVNLTTGMWADFSGDDSGGDLISLYAAIHGLGQGQAARALMAELGWQGANNSQTPAHRPSRISSEAAGMAGDAGGPPEPPIEGAVAAPGPDTVPAASPSGAVKRKSMWRAVVPVPGHAPKANFWHWEYSDVAGAWEYRFDGVFYGHVVRFTTSSGGKEVLPNTWCVDEGDDRGTQKWHWKQWDVPRPLYVPAHKLSGDMARIVVLVEGEKCAVVGHELLGNEFDFVSWPGGANAWSKADWSWLAGRTVHLWPDADMKRAKLTQAEREGGVDPATKPLLAAGFQPGMRAQQSIGSILLADHGCTVLLCPVPAPEKNATDGWDIADAIESGWGAVEVRAFIAGARPFVAPDDAARAKVGNSKSTAGLAGASSGNNGGGGAPGRVDAGADGPDVRWRDSLILTAQGSIKPVRENVVMALDGWPERDIPGVAEAAGVIAFNEFTNNVEKTRATPWGTPAGVWLESDELLMGQWLVREHWLPSMARATLEEAVLMVAQRHCVHPERARVLARRGRWDGVPRLKSWIRRCCLAEGEYDPKDPLQRYLARVGAWFLMGLCARVLPTVMDGPRIVRGPGTKFDTMLIFESPQGWGKSTLAAVLGGAHFADTGLLIGEKDSYQNIQGVLVYEWGELENLTRAEVTKVKLFISSPKDRFRASFDKRPRDYPRQVVFVGTTNERSYLTDVTGNRRFWPVQMTRPPDVGWLRENLDQLISEALVELDADAPFWPNREEQKNLFDPQQQERTVESSLESVIRHLLYDEDQVVPMGRPNVSLMDEIGMTELLDRVGYTIDKQTDVIVKKASALLHSLNWTVRRSSQGARPRLYVRPKEPGPALASASPSSTRLPPGVDQPGTANDCPF